MAFKKASPFGMFLTESENRNNTRWKCKGDKNKVVGSAIKTNKMNIDDIIAYLPNLDNNERARLQNALFELQSDLDLKEAIQEGLEDKKNGRVSSHEAIMAEIKAQYEPKNV